MFTVSHYHISSKLWRYCLGVGRGMVFLSFSFPMVFAADNAVRKILPLTEIFTTSCAILQNVLVPLVVVQYKLWKRVTEMLF